MASLEFLTIIKTDLEFDPDGKGMTRELFVRKAGNYIRFDSIAECGPN